MSNNSICRWAAALFFLPGLLHAADDTPPWLKDLTKVVPPQYPPKVNAVVLLNEEHTVAAEGGKLTTTTRTAIKILASTGTDLAFFDEYDTNSGEVRDFRAWMIPPSGKVKKYSSQEILDMACSDNDVYNECRRRMVSGKRDSEQGGIFAYESVIEYQSFSNQVIFHFQDSSPVKVARFQLTVPAGWEVNSKSFNGAPVEGTPSAGTYTWQMENLPALEHEEASPAFRTIAPWVGVNLLPSAGKRGALSWTDVAQVLAELNEGTAEPNETITAKARSLVEGAATEFDKIRAITRFTQQLNYVSIQVNLAKGGGYRPHGAAQTFQKLYGDCKDKANLTRSMLKAVGITAYPVAIYSGDRTHVMQEWPSLGAFNHAISAIQVAPETKAPAVLDDPNLGRLLLFDSTDPYVPAGFLPDHEQASLALVGRPGKGNLIRVPAAAAMADAHKRTVDAVLNADGSISGKFVDTRSGEFLSEALSAYRSTAKPDYLKYLERWIGHSIPAVALTGIEVSEKGEEFSLQAQFTSRSYAQRPQQDMLLVRAAVVRHGDLRLVEKTRKYPIVLPADALHESVRIQLPATFKVDELPRPVKLDSPFGKFEAKWVVQSGTPLFERTLEINAQSVSVSDYAALRKFLDTVSGTEEMPVVLVR